MLLASLALIGVLLSSLLLVAASRSLRTAEARLVAVRRTEMRHRAWAAESRRLLDARTAIADATSTTAGAVQLGTEITQAGHQAVAGIPFGILDAIPGAREGSRRVRGVHDDVAGAVYGGISAAAESLARLTRRGLTGETLSSPDEDGSDPPGQPSPPAPRPD